MPRFWLRNVIIIKDYHKVDRGDSSYPWLCLSIHILVEHVCFLERMYMYCASLMFICLSCLHVWVGVDMVVGVDVVLVGTPLVKVTFSWMFVCICFGCDSLCRNTCLHIIYVWVCFLCMIMIMSLTIVRDVWFGVSNIPQSLEWTWYYYLGCGCWYSLIMKYTEN